MFNTNLDNCHKEPIHIPGSVQSHGILLVIDKDDFIIKYVSDNIEEITEIQINEILNTKLNVFFGSHFYEEVYKNRHKPSEELQLLNPFTATLNSTSGISKKFDAIVSKNDKFILIDLEPYVEKQDVEFVKFYHEIRNFINSIVQIDDLQQIFEKSVEEIRRFTNFDRVMFYRFDEDCNGEVVAESKTKELNSFLHQHFPESDIPAQARALYIKNKIRLIADVNSIPSMIVPNLEPIDLSSSTIRSVSPIHIQYLKNMGVKASMSISIVVDNKLWGLIACHHYEKLILGFDKREVASYLSLIISHLITIVTRTQFRLTEAHLSSINSNLAQQMARESDFVNAFRNETGLLLDLVNAQGVAWNFEGKLEFYGNTPNEDDIDKILLWLVEKMPKNKSLYHTNNLSAENPEFSNISSVASGIMALPVSYSEKQFLIWFRPEIIATKNWGGKPEKIIEFTDDGSHRLMPRKSFELWQENVRNKSLPWSEGEISIALRFRNNITNYVLLKAERLIKLNDELEVKVKDRTNKLTKEINSRKKAEKNLQKALREAQLSNQELENFAYVASHDLQEPLRKIQIFGDRLKNMTNGKLDEKSQDFIDRMVSSSARMQMLIKDLLTFSRLSSDDEIKEEIDLNECIEDILSDIQILVETSKAKIVVGKLGVIKASPNQMNRLFQNLIQNSIKFSRVNTIPEIKIQKIDETDTSIHIQLNDKGIGFENKHGEVIFELFERLHNKHVYGGTGIGLSICKKIVEKHNGTITATGVLGEGATFDILLPK